MHAVPKYNEEGVDVFRRDVSDVSRPTSCASG